MYILSADVGTTNLKACLFEISSACRLLSEAEASYPLYPVEQGGMEQDHDAWYSALCSATKAAVSKSGIDPREIVGISLCAQMLGLVLIDRDGVAVRRPMNYLDRRATAQWQRGIRSGFRICGYNARRTLTSLFSAKIAPLDVRDTLWRYKWVEENEPECFSRACLWLDVKDYLNGRLTGCYAATEDTAFTTMLTDCKRGKRRFSPRLLRLFGVNKAHMPRVIASTDVVGHLTEAAASDMGLEKGIPVFGGGGDASCIPLGSGHAMLGATHVYIGTSGWVSTVCDRPHLDPLSKIATICGAREGLFHYHAEMTAAGKCIDWARCHIMEEEGGSLRAEKADEASLLDGYARLNHLAEQAPVGSGGVIFAPWLAGERCPVSMAHPCGMYFNLSLKTDRAALVRAVLEGVCYHVRWMMEKHERTVPTSSVIRLVGGGALSPVLCQMLSDVTRRTVETVSCPQNAGAVGAAILAAVGLGAISDLTEAGDLIPIVGRFEPNEAASAVYERQYRVYKRLSAKNKRLLAQLHEESGGGA